jgi:hypothetical protein
VVFSGIVGLAGVTWIALSVAAEMLTVTVVEPTKLPLLAEIVADPLATPVTMPAGLTVTLFVFEEDQIAVDVRSWVLPSE